MIDIEKVIKGLRCIKGDYIPCATCKYANADGYGRGNRRKRQCVSDAIALLEEQEEQIKSRDESLEKAREEIKWPRGMLKKQDEMISITTVAEYLADNAPPPQTVQHWESVMAWERFLLSLKGRKIRNDRQK